MWLDKPDPTVHAEFHLERAFGGVQKCNTEI